jgi:hypothetical protein
VQLLGNQTDGHQARVVMALGDDKNIILNVFIDHVPRIFATLFGAADTQPFTLAQGVVHQPLMGTDLLAVDGDFARLRRQVTPRKSRNLRSPIKQMPVESFSSR